MPGSQSFIIAITAATGTQGHAIISALASHNAALPSPSSLEVRALVRDPSSSKAKVLLKLSDQYTSVLLVQADFGSIESLRAACAPDETGKHVDAVFLNTSPTFEDAELEVGHARAVLKAVQEGKVKHIVYSSVLGITDADHEILSRIDGLPSWVDPAAIKALSPAHLPPREHIRRKSNLLHSISSDNPTRKFLQGYFGAKTQIEYLVATWGGTWSILRPAWFMTNFLPPSSSFYFPELASGQAVLRSAISKDSRLMLVDPEDIGVIGARALMGPLVDGGEATGWSLTNKTVNVGSQAIGLDDIAGVLGSAAGLDVKAEYVSEQDAAREVMEGNVQRDAQAWHAELQDCFEPGDLETLLGRKPRTFSDFLRRHSEASPLKLQA